MDGEERSSSRSEGPSSTRGRSSLYDDAPEENSYNFYDDEAAFSAGFNDDSDDYDDYDDYDD